MSTPIRARLVGALALGLLLPACSGAILPLAPSGLPGGVSGGQSGNGRPVTFTIDVDPSAFSDKRQITVRVWDAEQLKIANETGACTVSMNVQTGQETVSCPPGVTYRKATPEETIVSRAELARGLTVRSKTVTTGEAYRVSITGMASDDCNTASATAEGTAAGETVKLANLSVASTEMACQPTRGR